MIKQVDRYIGTAAILGIAGVWVVMNLVALMFNLLSELRAANGGYGTLDVFWFVFLTAPRAGYQIFPVCALIGALIGVGGLAAGNELVAFRTAGVSRLRIAGAALAGTLLMTTPVVMMGEWLAPAAEQQARVFRLGELIGQYVIGGPRGMWLRDGDRIVNIRQPLLTASGQQHVVQFHDIVIYAFSQDHELQQLTRAKHAAHDGDQWQLKQVTQLGFGREAITRVDMDRLGWESRLEPELVDAAVTRPVYMSARALLRQLEYLGQNGLDDRVYQSALFAKLMYPISVLALVLAGMPFVFGSARHHKLGVRIFIGMTVGAVFTIVNGAVQNLGDAYHFPALIPAVAPSLLLAAAAILALRRSV